MTPIPYAAGALALRPEADADRDFLLGLFRAARPPEWALFPQGPMLEQLMQMQFAAQRAGHKAQYPQAQGEVVLLDGVPVGRVLVDRQHLVDIALLPAHRSRGIGTAILRAMMREASAITLGVAVGNEAALRLYRRLGFAVTAASPTDVAMRWTA